MDTSGLPESPIRVLIAHSLNLISDALTQSLEKESRLLILEEKPTMGLDAVEVALKTKPDVMVMDHWLPVTGGPMAIRMILARKPRIRILAMSWLHSAYFISEAVEAGAVGYLPMNLSVDQVHDAILRAHAGETEIFEEERKQMVSDLIRRKAKSEHRFDLVRTLTPREVRTLWLLSSGREMKEVADAFKVTTGSLQTRLYHIFKKIGARSQIEAIAMATEAGLIPASYGLDLRSVELDSSRPPMKWPKIRDKEQ